MAGMKSEIRNGVDFAEVAEAIKEPTSSVLALMKTPANGLVCYFTRPVEYEELELDAPVYVQRLAYDADRILVAMGEPDISPFMLRELHESLEREFGS